LGPRWRWLAACFAFFGAIAGFGIGNTVQANSVADAMQGAFGIPIWVSATVMCVGVASVILGGVKRVASVAGFLVPIMAVSYLAIGVVILLMNLSAGAGIAAAIRFGVARGIFSNEAGLGSAPIAHAAAKTNNPVRQGMIAMLGTFIDTILVCSVTGFVILLSGVWQTGESGAALSTMAFESQIPGGHYIVAVGLATFAFTTMLGWSYYSERCVVYFFGPRGVMPFRIAWVLAIPLGAMANLGFIWLLADTLNALMAIPNLIALILLSPVVFQLTKTQLAAAKSSS
jgi:AGCS family alanine or glycine:cation symporter